MPTYVALLRGVNVGGHAKLPMADLRRVLESLGYDDVRTYVQSGNAVFNTKGKKKTADLTEQIERAIGAELGLEPKVLVRTSDELQSLIAANPFADPEVLPTQLHVMFLSAAIPAKTLASLDGTSYRPDQFKMGDRGLYLLLPNGLGRSKLPPYLSEKRLGVTTTTRNWNTVTKLAALAKT